MKIHHQEDEILGEEDSGTFQEQRTVTFPEEILEMIFVSLDSTEDSLHLSNSCGQFRRILHPSKPKWAFSEIFPLIFKELESRDILNCRLVCKQWKTGVDKFVQTHPMTRTMELYPYHPTRGQISHSPASSNIIQNPPHSLQFTPCLMQQGFVGLRLLNSNIVTKFISDMARGLPDQENPFVLREVSIGNRLFPDAPINYWNQIDRFLAKFGHHIWHVSIDTCNTQNRTRAYFSYKIIRRVLRKTPNLRTLIICGGTESLREPNRRGDMIRAHQLVRYIRSHPLAPLPHLQLLEELFDSSRWYIPIMDELLQRYSPQLQKLKISLSVWTVDNPLMINLPEVREVCLVLDGYMLEWIRFCSAAHSSKLTKLSLQILANYRIRQILSHLEENFESLVYLKLEFVRTPRNDLGLLVEIEPSLTLGRIKTLEIVHMSYIQYDLILSHLPNLEYLLICFRSDEDLEDQEEFQGAEIFEIHKWVHSGKMYKSNIWNKITSLKELTVAMLGESDSEDDIVSKKQYTRDMYNNFENQKDEKAN